MDPYVALAIVANRTETRARRDAAARELLAWIARGGFAPAPTDEQRSTLSRSTRYRHVLDHLPGRPVCELRLIEEAAD